MSTKINLKRERGEIVRKAAAGPGKIPPFAGTTWSQQGQRAALKDFPVRNVYYVLLTAWKVTWCHFHCILFNRRVTGSCRLWESYLRYHYSQLIDEEIGSEVKSPCWGSLRWQNLIPEPPHSSGPHTSEHIRLLQVSSMRPPGSPSQHQREVAVFFAILPFSSYWVAESLLAPWR